MSKFFNLFDFSISQCDFTDTIEEIHRFLFHITLVHIISYVIDGKEKLFGKELFKVLTLTALAIIIYNLLFKKIVLPNINKLKSSCKIPFDIKDVSVVATYGANM